MSRWLSIFGRMNTRYVVNGSRLEKDRGQNLDASRFSFFDSNSLIELQENVQLYFVKWKNLSYLHCSWESNEDLVKKEGPHMKQKMQVRFIDVNIDVIAFLSY